MPHDLSAWLATHPAAHLAMLFGLALLGFALCRKGFFPGLAARFEPRPPPPPLPPASHPAAWPPPLVLDVPPIAGPIARPTVSTPTAQAAHDAFQMAIDHPDLQADAIQLAHGLAAKASAKV